MSMIQAADVGVGIVGKEGKQASLAADYSISQFRNVGKLFLWHGRNRYLNTPNTIYYIATLSLIDACSQTPAKTSLLFHFFKSCSNLAKGLF